MCCGSCKIQAWCFHRSYPVSFSSGHSCGGISISLHCFVLSLVKIIVVFGKFFDLLWTLQSL